MERFKSLADRIVQCGLCPRLRQHCEKIAQTRKCQYASQTYWGKPVPGFGDPSAKLWIVGLAPAAHGANRTGRMFTGDSSGDWLYRALFEAGFSNQPTSQYKRDGLRLDGAFIGAAARCAPPDNKPSKDELRACAPFLETEFELLRDKRVLLALGAIAFSAVLSVLEKNAVPITRPKPRFGHGAHYRLGTFHLLCSYHPSRQNTQTGRLTPQMWRSIFEKARALVDEGVKKSSRV